MIALIDYPPPAIYDHKYAGLGSVLALPLTKVQHICESLGVKVAPGHIVFGCSWETKIACTIIIPIVQGEITQQDQDMISRVENANCNGWPKGNRE